MEGWAPGAVWPPAVPGLGPRAIGPFDPCHDCQTGSWARYGGLVLCLLCARRRARPAALEAEATPPPDDPGAPPPTLPEPEEEGST